MKKINRNFLITIATLGYFLVTLGCAYDTARVLKSVKKGMPIDEVQSRVGEKGEEKTIGDKTYYLFRLFEGQTQKYFGMRNYYVVITKDREVLEWGEYRQYFDIEKAPWSLKEQRP